jgi:Tfp pilus assembly protein PilW
MSRLTRALHRRLRAHDGRRDAGITLMELVVAMVLSTILGAVTTVLFVYVDNATSTATDRAISSAQARNVLQSWTSYLQVSDGPTAGVATNRFEWFTSTNIAFHSDLFNRSQTSLGTTNSATLVWLRLDGAGQLVEEQFNPMPASYPAQWTACRVLATNVSTTNSFSPTTVFTPYTSNGSSLATLMSNGGLGTAETASNGCQKLPSAVPSQTQHPSQTVVTNLQTIASVEITITVKDTKQSHPIAFDAIVPLPTLAGGT